MTEDMEQLGMPGVLDGVSFSEAEMGRFYLEYGQDIVSLSRMLATPTETRPFVYEIRFDLWPASRAAGLAVCKGFGQDGSLISFSEGNSLMTMVRDLHSRAQAGKLKFSLDKFQPQNYDKRLASYLESLEYKAAKLPSR